MAEKNEKAVIEKKHVESSRLPEAERGFFPTLVQVGADLATRSAEGGFGALRDLHGELFTRTSSAIDFVDEVQQGALGIVRRLVARVDHLTLATIGAGEQLTSAALRGSKHTGEGVAELVSRASDAAVGKRAA
jgi:hypothetical protein